MTIMVTAWNNGQHAASSAGYGLKISISDRDRYLNRSWKTVTLELEGKSEPVMVNIDKDSFWGPTCQELLKKEIGIWLRQNELAPWPRGRPPKLKMDLITGSRFVMRKIS